MDVLKVDHLKKEHSTEFLSLRSQFRELINKTRGFCDKAIPSLEFALMQFNAPNPVDVKTLAEKVLSRVHPEAVLSQCEQLENQILNFHDRIGSDEHYNMINMKRFLSIGCGAALAITSLIGFFFAPVLLEAEIAAKSASLMVSGISAPSVTQLLKGKYQL